MKPTYLTYPFLILLSCIALSMSVQAKPMTFYTCNWQELQRIAHYQNRPIFVEVFANDSDYSKEMSELFADSDVSDYYNANFINYRVDFNTELGKDFRQLYHVTSVPEMLYFDSDGTLMYRKIGNRKKEDVLQFAQVAMSRYLLTVDVMQQHYDKGYRAPAFLYDFAYKLKKSDLPCEQVVDDYVEKKRLSKHITSSEDLQFVYDFADNPYASVFSVLCKHRALFEKKYSAEVIAQKIENIALGTVHRAAYLHDQKLYSQITRLIEKSDLDNSEELLSRMEAAYFATSSER